ncbi:OLC1v1030638C1, partial [Oldenlandia corymbosa var. corymbosa]
LIGRVSNIIGHAMFKLNGVNFKLRTNDHGNTLHVDQYVRNKYISLHYLSHYGFPGAVDVYVIY